MAQGGEQYGQGEQPPWTWTSESGHHSSIPPRRPPAASQRAEQWPDPRGGSTGQLQTAPLIAEPPTRGSGLHRQTARSSGRTRRIAGALALVLLGAAVYFGIDKWLLEDGQRPTVATGCAGQKQLRLAVAPEAVPLVERAAAEVDGATCPTVTIAALEPGQAAATLGGEKVDGVVPASSAWLRLAAPSGASGPSPAPDGLPVISNAVSLMRTPVVVAVPRPAAESLGWPKRQASWAELTAATVGGKLRLSMGSPMRDTAGLLAVLGVHAAMGRTTKDQGIAQMRALTLRSRLADAGADSAAMLQRLETFTDPAAAVKEVGAFPATEQALWAYQAKSPSVSLAAIYPGDGLMEADYPLVLTPAAVADRTLEELAGRLIERFHAPSFAATVGEYGFRPVKEAAVLPPPTPTPLADGLLAGYPAAVATPSDPAVVSSRAAQWAKYERLAFQVLILLDASASMNDQVRDRSGNLTTKAALLRTAGVQAAQLFGLDTSVGVWLFATPTPTSPPYVEAVAMGPLDEPVGGTPRREAVRRMAESYTAYEKAGTPLYETVLRGVDAMRKLSKPDTLTMVVALTDGRDQDTSFMMPRAEFLSRLSAASDPKRPVPVFCIGYGADADMAALNDISKATGGKAAASNDPGDLAGAMAQIFLAAHAAH